MCEDINGDNDTSTVDCRLIWKRGGGEIPMLSAKTPVNVIKLKFKKGAFSYERK